MLNGYAFQKRLDEFKQQEQSKQQEQQLQKKHKQQREEQSINYKHRVERFIRDMVDNPIPIKNYQPNETQFRSKEDRSKMLGDALIRTKSFITEKVRIQQTIEHFKNTLDTEAPQNRKIVHEFRERDISKEIQPKMRFTAATQIERVIDAIANNRNSNESNGDKNLKRNLSTLATDQIHNSLMSSLQGAKKDKNQLLSPPPVRKPLDESFTEEGAEAKQKKSQIGSVENLFSSPITRKGKLLTFYSTNSSHRMRVAVSQFMLQNMIIAKTLNKDSKKLHFQGAQSVEMQHPGTLQNPQGGSMRNGSLENSLRKGGESKDIAYSILNTEKNFYPQDKMSQTTTCQLGASKSAFYLPVKNAKKRRTTLDNTVELSQTQTNHFKSHFQLPSIANPLLESKEKQQKMANYLQYRSQNPYEVKQRKENLKKNDDRQKVETLMQASYLDSPFYGTFYKNSQQTSSTKLLRFNVKPTDLEVGQSLMNGDQDIQEVKPKTMKAGGQQDKFFNLQGISNVKQMLKGRDQIEQAANEILLSCNAVMDNSRTVDKILKKGEGKTIAGNGQSNYEVYQKLHKTLDP